MRHLEDARVIYGWHPFTIGEVRKEHAPAELEITQTFDAPAWSKLDVVSGEVFPQLFFQIWAGTGPQRLAISDQMAAVL